jgi:hypothetical protein
MMAQGPLSSRTHVLTQKHQGSMNPPDGLTESASGDVHSIRVEASPPELDDAFLPCSTHLQCVFSAPTQQPEQHVRPPDRTKTRHVLLTHSRSIIVAGLPFPPPKVAFERLMSDHMSPGHVRALALPRTCCSHWRILSFDENWAMDLSSNDSL